MKNKLAQLHSYLQGELIEKLWEKYLSFYVLSESDMQVHVYNLLIEFLAKMKIEAKIHCNPGIYRKSGRPIHPDVAIFIGDSPWVVFEFKETWKQIKNQTIGKESSRIRSIVEDHGAARGYIITLSRYIRKQEKIGRSYFDAFAGKGKIYHLQKVMESEKDSEFTQNWEREFRFRSKIRTKHLCLGRRNG